MRWCQPFKNSGWARAEKELITSGGDDDSGTSKHASSLHKGWSLDPGGSVSSDLSRMILLRMKAGLLAPEAVFASRIDLIQLDFLSRCRDNQQNPSRY